MSFLYNPRDYQLIQIQNLLRCWVQTVFEWKQLGSCTCLPLRGELTEVDNGQDRTGTPVAYVTYPGQTSALVVFSYWFNPWSMNYNVSLGLSKKSVHLVTLNCIHWQCRNDITPGGGGQVYRLARRLASHFTTVRTRRQVQYFPSMKPDVVAPVVQTIEVKNGSDQKSG